jgi:dimethylargininase
MLKAITRAVSPGINNCQLTHLERVPIDFESASSQHRAYEKMLESIGIEVHSLPAESNLPDSVFVEDAAIVLEECAIITRMGADSRKPESDSIINALAPYRHLMTVESPGTVDGGDVLVIGKTMYIGLSGRSNRNAVEQIRSYLGPFGYMIQGIPVSGCLHLKSAATLAAEDLLVVNPAWVDTTYFTGMKFINVHPSEPYGANVLYVDHKLICQPVYSKTLALLRAAGFEPLLVDQSELGKAEGALTCCSLIFNA